MSKKLSLTVAQSTKNAATTTINSSTAYWIPRDNRARLRGLIVMRGFS
jgi:hypothetical protein